MDGKEAQSVPPRTTSTGILNILLNITGKKEWYPPNWQIIMDEPKILKIRKKN